MSVVAGDATQTVGQLGGWGGHHKLSTSYFARTQGEPVRARVSWIVRERAKGRGAVTLRAGAACVGQVEARLELG